jgi:hypothetical protein
MSWASAHSSSAAAPTTFHARPATAKTASASACKTCPTWPAYRVSSGELWGMQRRLNDCFRQQRFPFPGYASEVTVALATYMGVNSKGAVSIAPSIKR